MPADEIAEFAVKIAARVVIEFAPQLVFNRFVARYFHGIGRHVIALLSLGKLRIPSSLRETALGTGAKPTALDWVALLVGIIVWGVSAAGVFLAVFRF